MMLTKIVKFEPPGFHLFYFRKSPLRVLLYVLKWNDECLSSPIQRKSFLSLIKHFLHSVIHFQIHLHDNERYTPYYINGRLNNRVHIQQFEHEVHRTEVFARMKFRFRRDVLFFQYSHN